MGKINLEKAESSKKARLPQVVRSEDPIGLFPHDPDSIASTPVAAVSLPRISLPKHVAASVAPAAHGQKKDSILIWLGVLAAVIILLAFVIAASSNIRDQAPPTPPATAATAEVPVALQTTQPSPAPANSPTQQPNHAPVVTASPSEAPVAVSTPTLFAPATSPSLSTPLDPTNPLYYATGANRATPTPPTVDTALVLTGERFPQTRTGRLDPAEAASWSAEQIQYAINEMFARRGADFKDPKMVQWFSQFFWYERNRGATYDDIERLFSVIEAENLKMLARYRDARRAGVPPTQVAATAAPPNAADSQDGPQAKALYSVIGIKPGDTLNVRGGPGAHYPVIQRLPPGFSGFAVTGDPVANGPDRWVRITTPSGDGWVNAKYITVTQ